jgi:hypothetical protein
MVSSVYEGPIIDAHTHPMLGIDDQLVARPHSPELYREMVTGSAISRAAALVMAPRNDMEKAQARNDAALKRLFEVDRGRVAVW